MLDRKRGLFAPTDGVLSILSPDVEPERGEDFSDPYGYAPLFMLCVRRMRVSSRDVELADSTGSEISAKVELRSAPLLEPDSDVLWDGTVYEVTRVESRGRTSWVWLSEVACDGTCGLVRTSTARDRHGIPAGPDSDPVTVYCRKVAPSAVRKAKDSLDALRPSLFLRLRASDYDGETTVVRNTLRYSVTSVSRAGRWVDLTCEQKAGER